MSGQFRREAAEPETIGRRVIDGGQYCPLQQSCPMPFFGRAWVQEDARSKRRVAQKSQPVQIHPLRPGQADMIQSAVADQVFDGHKSVASRLGIDLRCGDADNQLPALSKPRLDLADQLTQLFASLLDFQRGSQVPGLWGLALRSVKEQRDPCDPFCGEILHERDVDFPQPCDADPQLQISRRCRSRRPTDQFRRLTRNVLYYQQHTGGAAIRGFGNGCLQRPHVSRRDSQHKIATANIRPRPGAGQGQHDCASQQGQLGFRTLADQVTGHWGDSLGRDCTRRMSDPGPLYSAFPE